MNGLARLIQRFVSGNHHPEGAGKLNVLGNNTLGIACELSHHLVLALSQFIRNLFLDIGKTRFISRGTHHPHFIPFSRSQTHLHLGLRHRFGILAITHKNTEGGRCPGSQIFRRNQKCLFWLGLKLINLLGLEAH